MAVTVAVVVAAVALFISHLVRYLEFLSSGVLSMVHGYRFMRYYIIEHELQRIRVICFAKAE